MTDKTTSRQDIYSRVTAQIVAANATLHEMLGYAPGEIAGLHVERLLTVAGRIFYQTHVFPTLKLQASVNEVYLNLVDADGLAVPVLLNAVRRPREDRFVSDWIVVAMRQRDEY